MLTRLRVSGFKNLVDVDVYFGPLTCIAGSNATGKSNLFDAIGFLSALADRPLMEAALSVRDEGSRAGDPRRLFHRVGSVYDERMSFLVEMLIPREGVDDLGQGARATTTFVTYELVLRYRAPDDYSATSGTLEIIKESLTHIKRSEASRRLPFPHTPRVWRKSVLQGRRTAPYISTKGDPPDAVIFVHNDSGADSAGRPLKRLAANLPRTVLSIANAAENPTALLARREMQSWRLLQLEPSSLRRPDDFTAPSRIGPDGSHLASTLYQLQRSAEKSNGSHHVPDPYAHVAQRLAGVISDVRTVRVDRDDRRELLTLEVTDSSGTTHPARALSDGTLRFLALAVLELERDSEGLLCLEEPENGIHPARIPAMLALLRAIATDAMEAVGPDNPLRQVIVNTHSPLVVGEINEDDLLVAELRETLEDGRRFPRASFSPLDGTWRAHAQRDLAPVAKGVLLSYLNPWTNPPSPARAARPRRVVDRRDLQPLLPWSSDAD